MKMYLRSIVSTFPGVDATTRSGVAAGRGQRGTLRRVEPRQGPAAAHRRGIPFVMTGASGVGKDTIRREAMPALGDVFYSISATTRPRRPGEDEGVQYYFLDKDRFEGLIREDGLLEWAEYVGDYYGTPRAPVEAALRAGRDVLLELELAGARQVRQALPDAVMIFIAPPSLAELERRLRGRGTDDEAKIQKRLARAREEIRAVREFDYAVVNDDLPCAVEEFQAIVRAERVRAARIRDDELAEFLREA
jgi:guanylate kinase